MIVEIHSQGQLEEIIRNNDVVVADFAAPAWCVPCRQFAPHYESASDKSDAIFTHIDVDNNPWAMVEYGVQSVPTVMKFEGGRYAKHLKERSVIKLLKELE